MADWTEILPLFFIKWYARRYCERWTMKDGTVLALARKDVYIRLG